MRVFSSSLLVRSPSPTILDPQSPRQLSHLHNTSTISIPRVLESDFTLATSVARFNPRSSFSDLPLLSPITASPVCTPPATLHSKTYGLNFEAEESPDHALPGQGKQSQMPSVARIMASGHSSSACSPPTWRSTPPTPPRRHRSRLMCVNGRRPSVPPFIPSASFSATLSPPAPDGRPHRLKRCVSLPAMTYFKPFPLIVESPRPAVESPRFTKDNGNWQEALLSAHILVLANDRTFPKKENANPIARPRPLFHISLGPASDNEDDVSKRHENKVCGRSNTADSGSTAGSSPIEHSSEELLSSETTKENTRRYHALMELLMTEVGYLRDLRTLVHVYLRLIDSITCQSLISVSSALPFNRSHSTSFLHSTSVSRSRFNSYPLPTSDGPSTFTVNAKEKAKSPSPFLLSSVEAGKLARNAAEILQIHDLLVEELRFEVAPFGLRVCCEAGKEPHVDWNASPVGRIDAAISVVAARFTAEASRFNSYISFCSGHAEALEVVRKIQQQHPIEWDAIEQRAAYLTSGRFVPSDGASPIQIATPPFEARLPGLEEWMRMPLSRCSDTPDDGPTLAARGAGSRGNKVDPTGGSNSFFHEAKGKGSTFCRLSLTDYLIKPVQRICKYPLLLNQLKSTGRTDPLNSALLATSKHNNPPQDVNVIVENALQAMRHVASAVDEARHRQDISIQSSLIISRISLALPFSSVNHLSDSLLPTSLSTFLNSLGACLLAGSLDVIHYPATGATINAKYLGAFLYMGGYFVLVKVRKGKVYQAKHWFSLGSFNITDVAEEALLPCSFRLSCKGHQFELAAACQREKEIWISSLRQSVMVSPTWKNEPVSSLSPSSLSSSILAGEPTEALGSLPTIQSIPELAGSSNNGESSLNTPPCRTEGFKPVKPEAKTGSDPSYPASSSRRSSTVSVKAIFSPLTADPNVIVIRRSSPSARLQIDHGLHDVISKPCIIARSHASIHDEELFQAPKFTRSNISRSSSGLSMAGAMGAAAKSRLTKHESLRILRKKGIADTREGSKKLGASSGDRHKRMIRTGPLAGEPNPTISTVLQKPMGDDERQNRQSHHSDALSDSSVPLSQCSSRSISDPNSTVVSPVSEITPFSLPPASHGPNVVTKRLNPVHMGQFNRPPKRTRSMVDSVRSLFHPRQISWDRPVPGSRANELHGLGPLSSNPGLFKRWTVGSLHRRVRSASDVPRIEQPLSTPCSNVTGESDRDSLSVTASGVSAYHFPSSAKPVPQHVSSIPPSSPPDCTDSNSNGFQKNSFLRRLKVIDSG